MACLTSLPDDILLLIIGSVATRSYNKHELFKPNLGLLAICSRLRRLALPLVYQHAYVIYTQKTYDGIASSMQAGLEEATDADINTNLDLAKHIGGNLAQSFFIYVHCMAEPVKELTKILQMIGDSALKVHSLTVSLDPLLPDYTYEKQHEDFKLIANELASLMPQIKHLRFFVDDNPDHTLVGYIADNYAHQLLSIASSFPFPTSKYFSRLESLDIYMAANHEYKLPLMNTETLTYLNIEDGAYEAVFPYSGTVELPNLKCIRVETCYDFPPSSTSLQLVVPRLERYYNHKAHSILERAILPKSMKEIHNQSGCATYKELSKIKLPDVDSVCLSTRLDEEDGDVVVYMNQVLKNLGNGQRASLKISGVPVLPNQLDCERITELEIRSPIEMDTVVSLLDRLPRLAEMSLLNIIPNTSAGLFDASSNENRSPLVSYNTRNLQFVFHMDGFNSMVKFAVFLIVRMPLLSSITVSQISQSELFEQLRPFVPECPHIPNVQYSLAEQDCEFPR